MKSAILLVSLILSSILFTFLSADSYYPQNCQSKSCGKLGNVTFPFFLRDHQPDYCGLPAFEIRCHENVPKLSMPEEDYIVLDISYEKQTLAVSMSKFASPEIDCLLPYYNISFGLTPFVISSLNRELVFVYNCSAAGDGFVEIGCRKNKTYAYMGGSYQIGERYGIMGSCFTAVMPVLSPVGGDLARKYVELLAGGFLLNWTAPDCSECLRSNGQCGYNNETRNFMCICPDRPHWKSCTEGRSSKTALKIGLSTAGGFIGFIVLCLLIVCLLLYRRRRTRKFSRWRFSGKGGHSFELSKGENEGGTSLLSHIFSYDELYQATNGFHASKELGGGGFGAVYKGKLKDGRVVAVKRLYENNYRRLEQFMNEVKILSLLRHPNLVTLYGCTSRRSRELLLVYEFVPNGTVADHLHGPQSSLSFLPWHTRLAIAIQTADALHYLHSIEPQIIHRDVKTTNILLDASFHVKVADFGLSRLFPPDATHVSTAPQGTPGYLDPEYHQFYQLTDKSDVYSFGVMLMELISSMPAVDIGRERSEVNLANLAAAKIRRRELDEFVDQRLGFQSDSGVRGMIIEVAALGMRCLEAEGEARPGIKEVVEILKGIESIGRAEVAEAKEDARLITGGGSFSPSSVTERWLSTSSSTASFRN